MPLVFVYFSGNIFDTKALAACIILRINNEKLCSMGIRGSNFGLDWENCSHFWKEFGNDMVFAHGGSSV